MAALEKNSECLRIRNIWRVRTAPCGAVLCPDRLRGILHFVILIIVVIRQRCTLRSAWYRNCTVRRVPSPPSPPFVTTLQHTLSVHRSDSVTSHTVTVADEAGGTESMWTGTGGTCLSVALEHFKKRHNQGLEGDI